MRCLPRSSLRETRPWPHEPRAGPSGPGDCRGWGGTLLGLRWPHRSVRRPRGPRGTEARAVGVRDVSGRIEDRFRDGRAGGISLGRARSDEPGGAEGRGDREVGKRVSDLVQKEAALDRPDVVAVLDTGFDHVDLQVNPLYLRGRYRKLSRGVPQTRWPCRRCRGKGCDRCGGTGKMYPTSVEEVIAAEVMRESGGTGHALHGMGREDVDARMLGRGRPFILEIKEPRRRHLDVASAVARINASGMVEVDGLGPARGADVVGLKEDRAAKTYRVLFRTVPPVGEAKLKGALPVLVPEPIAQQTPERVVHRRADTTRHRRILAAEVVRVDGDRAEIRVTAEAGTYIKEWVHGDRGRTSPSLAERLGVACEVIELDVLDVLDDR